MPFLEERGDARDLPTSPVASFTSDALFVGRGPLGLEVAAYFALHRPTVAQLHELHERRQARRPTPILVVVTYGDGRAAISTRFGEEWSTHTDLELSQAERLALAALEAPDRHAADAYLRTNLTQLDQPVPGLRNAGLFAMHELEEGVPARPDWRDSCAHSRLLLGKRGRDLLAGLGFTLEQTPGPVAILRTTGTRTAVAVFLDRPDEIEPANVQ